MFVFVALDANIHVRDHSGKKPRDVVRETVAAEVQSKFFAHAYQLYRSAMEGVQIK